MSRQFCPVTSSPDWINHESLVKYPYTSWIANKGNPMNLAPNGANSVLFEDLKKSLSEKVSKNEFLKFTDLHDNPSIQQTIFNKQGKVKKYDYNVALEIMVRLNSAYEEEGFKFQVTKDLVTPTHFNIIVSKIEDGVTTELQNNSIENTAIIAKASILSNPKSENLPKDENGEVILNEESKKLIDFTPKQNSDEILKLNLSAALSQNFDPEVYFANLYENKVGATLSANAPLITLGFKSGMVVGEPAFDMQVQKLLTLTAELQNVTIVQSSNTGSTLTSRYTEGLTKNPLNVQEELATLRKILPNVPITVRNGLLHLGNGEVAEGTFADGVITIFTGGSAGVGLHEAFHAVSTGILTEKQRNIVYNELRALNPSLSDEQIEEELAEKFREWYLGKGDMKDMPSLIKYLYNIWKDLVMYFTNSSEVDKLFNRIRNGKYASSKFTTNQKQLFSKLGIYNDMQVEIVEALTYLFVEKAGFRLTEKDLDLDSPKAAKFSEQVFVEVHNAIIDIIEQAEENGEDEELIDRLYFIVQKGEDGAEDNWTPLKQIVKYELMKYSIGFEDKKSKAAKESAEKAAATVEEDQKVKGGLNIGNAVNFEGKQNATGQTKLLIAMLQDSKEPSKYFGEYLPKLANYDKTYRALEDGLANVTGGKIVDGKPQSIREALFERLKEISQEHPQLQELVHNFETKKVSDFKQRQFFTNFHKTKVNYRSSLYRKDNESSYTVKKGDADQNNKSRIIRAEWSNDFILKHVNSKGQVFNVDILEASIKAFEDAYKYYSKKETTLENVEQSYNTAIERLTEYLNNLGIEVSEGGLAKFVTQQYGEDLKYQMSRAFEKISKALSGTKVKNTLVNNIKNGIDPHKNFITDQRVFLELAEVEVPFRKLPTSNVIKGSDNKDYWTKSLNNNMTKTLQLWKNNPELIKQLNDKQYHKGSHWLPMLYENNLLRDQVEVTVWLFNKLEQSSDVGVDYSDLIEKDEFIERLNDTLYGRVGKASHSTLTLADKSLWYNFEGFPTEVLSNFQKEGSKGISEKGVDIFYKYALAEAEKISYNLRNSNDYTEYKGTESFWFPELNYDSKFAKDNALYNADFSININAEEAIKEMIADTLVKRIAEVRQKLTDNGVLLTNTEKGKKVEYLLGVDKSIQAKYSLGSAASKQAIDNMIGDFVMNNMIANIETTMLFTGDPAFYKDLAKRTPAISSTGTDYIPDETAGIPENYNLAISTEPISSTIYEDSLKKAFIKDVKKRNPKISKEDLNKKVDSLMKPYLNMKTSDGGGLITPKRWRDIMRAVGVFNDEKHGPLYDKLIEDFSAEGLTDLMKQMGFPYGNPIKGHHFELIQKEDSEIAQPLFLKYSQFVAWAPVVKGTILEDIVKNMEANNIDELVPPSAVKVGMESLVDFDMLSTLGVKLKPITLSNMGWKLQTETPSKYEKKGESLVGSQPQKNILVGILGKSFVIDGETVSGEEMFKRLQEIQIRLSDKGLANTRRSWGMKPVEVTIKGETVEIYDDKIHRRKHLYDELIEEFRTEGTPENIIEALEMGVPFDALFQGVTKIQNKLRGKVKNNAVQTQAHGGAFIQIPNTGFAKKQGFTNHAELVVASRNELIYLKDVDQIHGPHIDKSGKVIPGDVFLPYSVIKKIPNIDQLIKEGKVTGKWLREQLGEGVLDVIGYRIPNQGLSSIDTLEIAGILPPFMGDSIVTYTEIVGKTGSDFDIDKMYVLMPNTVYNKNTGKVEIVTPNTSSKKGLENLRIKLWKAVLENPESFGEVMTSVDADWLAEDAYYVEALSILKSDKSLLKTLGFETIEQFTTAENKKQIARKALSNRKYKALEFASPLEQVRLKKVNLAGKAGVAQNANHIVHIPLAQQAHLGFNGNITNVVKGTNTLDSILNADKEDIAQVTSAWVTAYVDCAKDPYIALLNNNTKTSNTVSLMVRMGISPEYVNRFMTQPIIVDYINELYNQDSRFKTFEKERLNYYSFKVDSTGSLVKTKKTGRPDIVNRVLSKYEDVSKIKTIIKEITTVQGLEAELLNPTKNQVEIFKQFLIFQKYGSDLSKVVKASRYDVTAGEKDSASAYAQQQVFAEAMSLETITNVENLFEDTALGTYKRNSADFLNRVLSREFLTDSKGAIVALEEYKKAKGIEYLTNYTEINEVLKALKAYSHSASYMTQRNGRQIQQMFFGENTMVHKLTKLKEMYPESVLIDSLVRYIEREDPKAPMFIYLPSSKITDVNDINTLLGDFEELYSEFGDNVIEDGYTVRNFLDDLAAMSYYTSGFNRSFNSFFEILPASYLAGKLAGQSPNKSFYNNYDIHNSSNVYNRLRSLDSMENFSDQFFRHNFGNDGVMPVINLYSTYDYNTFTTSLNTAKLTTYGIKPYLNFTMGFTIEDENLPELLIANTSPVDPRTGEKGEVKIPVAYMSIVNNFNDTVHGYKYAGKRGNTHYFTAVTPLGLNNKGYKILEYQVDKSVISAVNPTVQGLPLEVLASVQKENSYGDSAINFGKRVDIDEESFTFDNIKNKTFKLKEIIKDNQTYYQGVVEYVKAGLTYTRTVTELMYPNKEEALTALEEKLRKHSVDIVDDVITNMC
jgi:hypothetical protein